MRNTRSGTRIALIAMSLGVSYACAVDLPQGDICSHDQILFERRDVSPADSPSAMRHFLGHAQELEPGVRCGYQVTIKANQHRFPEREDCSSWLPHAIDDSYESTYEKVCVGSIIPMYGLIYAVSDVDPKRVTLKCKVASSISPRFKVENKEAYLIPFFATTELRNTTITLSESTKGVVVGLRPHKRGERPLGLKPTSMIDVSSGDSVEIGGIEFVVGQIMKPDPNASVLGWIEVGRKARGTK